MNKQTKNSIGTKDLEEKIFMVLFEKYLEHDDSKRATEEILNLFTQQKKEIVEMLFRKLRFQAGLSSDSRVGRGIFKAIDLIEKDL